MDAKTRSPRWAFMQRLDIPDASDPTITYLRRRRVIQTPWFGFYMHWIYLPDGDRDPHNHPWSFATFILRGGYTERFHVIPEINIDVVRTQRWRRFSWHRMSRETAHRIVELREGTISLIFVGPRRASWGFHTAAGFVDWKDYPAAGLGPDPFGFDR